MLALSDTAGVSQPAISGGYHRMLVREILRTEILRVKALIVTATVFVVGVTAVYTATPQTVLKIWHGHFQLTSLYITYAAFVGFELAVLSFVNRQRKRDLDVPRFRRYLGVLVETSLPSLVLVAQMRYMGPQQALGFVVPMVYFIFIILSTLRLDFWLSSFTGAVAAVELFAIAMFGPMVGTLADDPIGGSGYHFVRSAVILLAGLIAGAVGLRLRRQFETSIVAAGARDYVTNLFGQHVSPQVVEKLLATGSKPDGDTGDVAVMFVDIRGFTAAARLRTPREVVKRLDDAFAILVEIVDRNGAS